MTKNHPVEVDTLIFPSLRKVQKLCLKYGYPSPPCTPEKKVVCYANGNVWYVQKCLVEERETERCSCTEDQGLFYILMWIKVQQLNSV